MRTLQSLGRRPTPITGWAGCPQDHSSDEPQFSLPRAPGPLQVGGSLVVWGWPEAPGVVSLRVTGRHVTGGRVAGRPAHPVCFGSDPGRGRILRQLPGSCLAVTAPQKSTVRLEGPQAGRWHYRAPSPRRPLDPPTVSLQQAPRSWLAAVCGRAVLTCPRRPSSSGLKAARSGEQGGALLIEAPARPGSSAAGWQQTPDRRLTSGWAPRCSRHRL